MKKKLMKESLVKKMIAKKLRESKMNRKNKRLVKESSDEYSTTHTMYDIFGRFSDDFYNLVKEMIEDVKNEDINEDNLYDVIREEIDTSLIYTNDEWEVIKHYFSPEDIDVYNEAIENLIMDIGRCVEAEMDEDSEELEEESRSYDLHPENGRKSFYGKARVEIDDNGDEILYSYNTPIIKKTKDGELIRLYDGWTATTGRHIDAFCGLNKKEFLNLPLKESKKIVKEERGQESYDARSIAEDIFNDITWNMPKSEDIEEDLERHVAETLGNYFIYSGDIKEMCKEYASREFEKYGLSKAKNIAYENAFGEIMHRLERLVDKWNMEAEEHKEKDEDDEIEDIKKESKESKKSEPRITIRNIEWDTDDEDVNLPKKIDVTMKEVGIDEDMDEDEVVDAISDYLSNEYEWLPISFKYKK